MSQWSAYYFSLLKKKKKKPQGKFAFDEFNKSEAATEEIFSKIIQHGAELKTARWPKVDRLGFKTKIWSSAG